MNPLSLAVPADGPTRVLCLGAHSDDIEIGCGGTVLTLLGAAEPVHVRWVVFSGAGGPREKEARRAAERFLEGAVDVRIDVHGFRDGFFPGASAKIKETFETLKDEEDPDLILTHRKEDAHQDHRVVAELTWNTFRDHLVLEYEIPKYDGDLGRPNVFVPVPEWARRTKVDLLTEVFSSQRGKRWFTPETFEGLMRIRGVESASPTGYAEGFHGRKLAVDLALDR